MVRWPLAVALAVLLLFPAVAGAQTNDPQNRALIVLDGSLSMNKDAGNGGTRLDAAKTAVHSLLDKLPPGSNLGLRVYGSRLDRTTRPRSRGHRAGDPGRAAGQGRHGRRGGQAERQGHDADRQLAAAAPQDLGSQAGRRSVVLICDGGDNCAPPDPCKAAAQVAKQGIDLSISVVGLQVDPRARRQLQCIAKAGGGSYVDVPDADKLGDELAAALARAFRSYEPSGTKVTGGTAQGQPTALGTGLYQDVITPYGQRWYAIDVPAGRRLVTW